MGHIPYETFLAVPETLYPSYVDSFTGTPRLTAFDSNP